MALRAALLLCLPTAACSVRAESNAHVAEDAALPSEQPATTEAQRAAEDLQLIYLVRNNLLVPTARPHLDDLAARVRQVLVGPTTDETRTGLRSALPSGTILLSATTTGDLVSLDLSGEFATIGGQEQILALAQLVYTATSTDPTSSVRVEIEGRAIDLPRADGSLRTGPATRADYAALVSAG